jgi:hypothetical protein
MDFHQQLLHLLRSATAPVTAGEVRRLLPEEHTQAQVRTGLEELASWGQVQSFHGWGKTTLFSLTPPLELCAAALAELLAASSRAQKMEGLSKRLPKSLAPWFEEALGRLIIKGQAFYVASRTGEQMVQARQPKPTDALNKTQLKSLESALVKVNALRKQPRHLDELLAWLNDSTVALATVRPEITVELLKDWFVKDSGKGSSCSLVPIVKTYERYVSWLKPTGIEPDIAEFKAALLCLYDEGGAILEPPERLGSLTDLERSLLVPVTIGPSASAWGMP